MATIHLRAPLKDRAGASSVEVGGATVVEALAALEERVPEIKGWVLDERRNVRRHVNVFVDGEQARSDDAVSEGARIDIIGAITGGCA